jgi:hypothetical protein
VSQFLDREHANPGDDPVGHPACPAMPSDPCRDVVIQVAAHAGELPRGVEVANNRHVRVGGFAIPVEQRLARDEQDLGEADLGGLDADPVRADAKVTAAG